MTGFEIVPIESLFFADAGPHVFAAPPGPAAHGSALESLLASGISGLGRLGSEPFSTPAEIDDTLPIGDLIYKGRGALDRALELRNEIRVRGTPPAVDEIDELFALLDLAVAE
jgi:hypothetical protein